MRSGTTFERGDVVLIRFPFTDLSAQKRRPVLVLSRGGHNRKSEDFIVCAITSVLIHRPHAVALHPEDLLRGRLPVESRIRPDKIFTLKQALAIRVLGRVKPTVLDRVWQQLTLILG